jgi:hypothetical protein
MNKFISPERVNVFSVFARKLPDGTYSGHVSHKIEGASHEKEKIYDVCISGTEREALEEAHAYASRYIAEHNYDA